MKTIALILSLSAYIQSGVCQNNTLPRIQNDTLYTSCGYKITVGQEIKLGTGTRDNGDFKYILSSAPPSPGGKPSMKKTSTYKIATVKKLKPKGDEQKGYIYYIIISTGSIIHYECDAEKAIAAGEIIVPDKYKSALNKGGQLSVADEISKLKKLYDDSVITKEEFEAQKKKLLDGNE